MFDQLLQTPWFLFLGGVALYVAYVLLRRLPKTLWWTILRTMVLSTGIGMIIGAFSLPPLAIVAMCIGATICCFHIAVALMVMVVNRPR